MLHTTKAIVLRSTKYGETSVIVNLFTEILGIQTYIINGVRQRTKKTGSKEMLFEPGNILQIVAYANDQKNMNRLKEFEYAYLYKTIPQSILKNALLTYCVELTSKGIQEPGPIPEVFNLLESVALHLDKHPLEACYNIALYYSLQLAQELGFGIDGGYSMQTPYLHLADGLFVEQFTNATLNCSEVVSESIHNILIADLAVIDKIQLHASRKNILETVLQYLQMHLTQINTMRSPEILQSLFE
jgi:DNA repair protein RecO (recombination protein O)